MKPQDRKRFRDRAKALFAERIAAGDTPAKAGDFVKTTLRKEFNGPGEWIALLQILLPLIKELIAAFKK